MSTEVLSPAQPPPAPPSAPVVTMETDDAPPAPPGPPRDVNGRYVAAGAIDGGFGRMTTCVRWSPAGDVLAIGSCDATAKLFKEVDGAWTRCASLEDHDEGVNDVTWASDETCVVTASDDKTAKLWDAATGRCAATFSGHESYVFGCALNPANTLVATCSFDETVKLWDPRVARAVLTLDAHSEPVTAVAFNGLDGSVLATGSYDGLVRLWDVASGECLSTIFAERAGLSAQHAPVSHTAYSPNGEYVLASTHDSTIRLWHVAGNPCRLAREFTGRRSERYCCTAAFHVRCDRRRGGLETHAVVAGDEAGAIRVWDMQSGAVAHEIVGAHDGAVLGVDPHPKRDLLASCSMSNDRLARLWTFQEH